MDITTIATIKTNEGTESVLDLNIPVLIDLVPARKFKVIQELELLGHTDVAVDSVNMDVYKATSTLNGEKQHTTVKFGFALRSGDRLFGLTELHGIVKK
ncbi:hypothetical protein ACWV26_18245 [Rummeliibacillus sp. JY-2-4R]